MKKGESPGVKIRPNGSASVQIFFRGHAYYLGVYPSLEKARAVREEAERHKSMGDLPEWAFADAKRHVADGDFAEWLEAWKQDRKTSRKKKK